MFRYFDHTADIGMHVEAPDLPGLFAEAARALTALLVENPQDVRPQLERTFAIRARRLDDLLFDWLSELLFVFETEHLLFNGFEVRLLDGQAQARARGEAADPQRHRLDHEVKAITYHGLRVEEAAGGWVAEVIVDI